MMLNTSRTRLRPWRDCDRPVFAALMADPMVMTDLGGPIDRAASGAKLNRYIAAYERYGVCRWAVEALNRDFLGYAGVMPLTAGHPLAPGWDIGWRLVRSAWGHGYATEAAATALDDAFARLGLPAIVAFSAPDNHRSQAVMGRLAMLRDPARDFTAVYDGVSPWRGQVWVARRGRISAPPIAQS
ncbi:GNAT family N-acetyltransferase [Thalassobaculum sp.]|uniref:GNAT family N-acetyltransferase n=1 Tax=Thalassobaculum sp. TaxID=2022740 RepID=UPI0032EC7047